MTLLLNVLSIDQMMYEGHEGMVSGRPLLQYNMDLSREGGGQLGWAFTGVQLLLDGLV